MPSRQVKDEVAGALNQLADALEANARDERMLARRVRRLQDQRAKGASVEEMLTKEQDPGTILLLGLLLSRLNASSGRVRRALASELRAGGETIPSIARRFGVSHQRISSLLRTTGATGSTGRR